MKATRWLTSILLICVALPCAAQSTFSIEQGVDRPGMDIGPGAELARPDPELCLKACEADPKCLAYTFVKPGVQGPSARCWLKSAVPKPVANTCCISGVRRVLAREVDSSAQRSAGLVTGVAVKGELIEKAMPFVTAAGFEIGLDRAGSDYRNFQMDDPRPDLCRAECEADSSCKSFTYVRGGLPPGPKAHCWLKNAQPSAKVNPLAVSGLPRPLVPKMAVVRHVTALEDFNNEPSPGQASLDWQKLKQQGLTGLNEELRRIQRERRTSIVQQATKLLSTSDAFSLSVSPPPLLQSNVFQSQATTLRVAERVKPFSPEINRMVSVSSQETTGVVDEGGALFIAGKGFGPRPGSIRLTFSTSKEFAAPDLHSVELLPLSGSWTDSWSDTLIMARVPFLIEPIFRERIAQGFGAPAIASEPRPMLHLTTSAGPVDRAEIGAAIVRRGVGMSSVVALPPKADLEHLSAITAKGALHIAGVGFGDSKGPPPSVWVDLTDKITPESESPVSRVVLDVVQWDQSNIVLKVPERYHGNYPFVSGMLKVRNDVSGSLASQGVYFGPEMELVVIGGENYFEPEHKSSKDSAHSKGPILTVTHDPDCTVILGLEWFGEGNDGNDWFFRNKPLPANARLVRSSIYWHKPGDTDDIVYGWFGDEMKHLATDFYEQMGDFVVMMLGAMFDSDYGSFVLEIGHLPTTEKPSFSVHWENTCHEMYAQKPIVYSTSFAIWAPSGYVFRD